MKGMDILSVAIRTSSACIGYIPDPLTGKRPIGPGRISRLDGPSTDSCLTGMLEMWQKSSSRNLAVWNYQVELRNSAGLVGDHCGLADKQVAGNHRRRSERRTVWR